jgi:hypothetical protein
MSCQFAQVEPERAFSPLTLHPELERYLEEHLPTCEVLTQEHYEPRVLRAFAPRWQVTGDFDGNGEQDICLLMKCPLEGMSAVAVHRTADGFEHFVVDRWQPSARLTVDTEGPGPVVVSGGDEAYMYTTISNPAITVRLMETCDVRLYYWENGRYQIVRRGI